MTALGVCQQGKVLDSPPRVQASIRFGRLTGGIGSLHSFHEKSGPESVFEPGIRPRCVYAR